jgi:hypothetical protein
MRDLPFVDCNNLVANHQAGRGRGSLRGNERDLETVAQQVEPNTGAISLEQGASVRGVR